MACLNNPVQQLHPRLSRSSGTNAYRNRMGAGLHGKLRRGFVASRGRTCLLRLPLPLVSALRKHATIQSYKKKLGIQLTRQNLRRSKPWRLGVAGGAGGRGIGGVMMARLRGNIGLPVSAPRTACATSTFNTRESVSDAPTLSATHHAPHATADKRDNERASWLYRNDGEKSCCFRFPLNVSDGRARLSACTVGARSDGLACDNTAIMSRPAELPVHPKTIMTRCPCGERMIPWEPRSPGNISFFFSASVKVQALPETVTERCYNVSCIAWMPRVVPKESGFFSRPVLVAAQISRKISTQITAVCSSDEMIVSVRHRDGGSGT